MYRYCQTLFLSLVAIQLTISPLTGQTESTRDQALIRVPIEVRFDLLTPCIEQKRDDPSIGMAADVFVDGHLDRSVINHTGSGREELELTAGAHDVEVTAAGFSSDKKTIMVRPGSNQRFAFHVRADVQIAVELMRTNDPDRAHKLVRKLTRAGEPATIRTVQPDSGTQPELLLVQVGPFPTCYAAQRQAELFEHRYERAVYVVAQPR